MKDDNCNTDPPLGEQLASDPLRAARGGADDSRRMPPRQLTFQAGTNSLWIRFFVTFSAGMTTYTVI
jgi:hypothetical protein